MNIPLKEACHTALMSVLIPARNESQNIVRVISSVGDVLEKAAIPYEIIVIDDHSIDDTRRIVEDKALHNPRIRLVKNDSRPGYGFAVIKGLEHYKGDMAVIMMADGSDDAQDLPHYYHKMQQGYECVFGNRFCPQARVSGYPWHKLILNRLGNFFIKTIFWIPYGDVTNAFKCYSRRAINGMRPLISCHFNLTVEMPLKAIVRGYRWTVIPTNWAGRIKGIQSGKSKKWGRVTCLS